MKLEERLDEAYNDLEAVDRMYDNLTQDNREQIDYCIKKRKLVCERIKLIKSEMDLDKQYIKEESSNEIVLFILDCVRDAQKIEKIRYKKDTAVSKQFGI